MTRDTFIIRTEWYEAISELDPTDQATMFRNLFAYHAGTDIDLSSFAVRIVWKLIEPTLCRNIDSYDKRTETNRLNGAKGGRPANPKQTDHNPNNPTVIMPKTQKPIVTLSDSDSDSDSYSDSESYSESEKPNPQPEKIKDSPEHILPPPGEASQQAYYETEICMPLSYTLDEVKMIHLAWVGDRLGTLFTLKEARQKFRGYANKFRMNKPNKRSGPYTAITNASAPMVQYSDLG